MGYRSPVVALRDDALRTNRRPVRGRGPAAGGPLGRVDRPALPAAALRHGPLDGHGERLRVTGRRRRVDVDQPGRTGHVPPQRAEHHAARHRVALLERRGGLRQQQQGPLRAGQLRRGVQPLRGDGPRGERQHGSGLQPRRRPELPHLVPVRQLLADG